LVVMSIETYEKLMESVRIDEAIAEAEKEYAGGAELMDAKDTLASLRRKHIE